MGSCAGEVRRAGVKVGHGGTLDPMATGVLVVLIGKATPLCNAIMAGEKEYVGEVDLAHRSNTDDAEGLVEAAEIRERPTREQVEEAAGRFVGRISQVPPAFSALNIGGRRAYQIAREGGSVELAAREVDVKSVGVVSYEWPRVGLSVVCGKGVYIRSIARDLGGALGCGGMLTALRRTRVGRFVIAESVRVQDLPDELRQEHLLPIPEDLRPG